MRKICAVLLMMVLLAGCSSSELPSVKSVVQTVQRSTVLITVLYHDGSSAAGTGFFVQPNMVVTAAHGVNPLPEAISIRMADDSTIDADPQNVYVDVAADVAIIVVGANAPPLTVSSKEVGVGDWAIASGHPGGRDEPFTVTATVSNILNSEQSVLGCFSAPGMSGGPVVNTKGQVVGMIVAGEIIDADEKPCIFIPLSVLKPAIEKLTK